MPNYAGPLGTIGGTAGTAGGGSVLGALGRLLEPLDYPRRALWNVPGKLAQGDILGALPGILGLGAGAATALTGYGLPLAASVGSLVGGLGQAVGGSVDEERFAAPMPAELVGDAGMDPESTTGALASFLLGMAGDPLTYAGGLGGGQLGRRAGQAYGGRLEDIARWMGPEYPTTPEILMSKFKLAEDDVPDWLRDALTGPQGPSIASTVDPQARLLGQGVEGVAFGTGSTGPVTRLAHPSQTVADILDSPSADVYQPPAPRSATSEVLPALWSRPYPGGDPLADVFLQSTGRSQAVLDSERAADAWIASQKNPSHYDVATIHTPGVRAEMTPFVEFVNANPADADEFFRGGYALRDALADKGMSFWDGHMGNLARLPGTARYVVSDPGAVAQLSGGNLVPASGPELMRSAEGSALERALIRLLGGPQALRSEIAQAARNLPPTTGVLPRAR